MANLLTALSVLAALFTWYVTHRRDVYHKRIEYTAEVLSALSTSDRLSESSFQVTRLINQGVRISLADIDPDVERHVVDILDYYEFLCDLYTKRVIDQKTVIQLRGRLMRRTWNLCEQYVRETGEAQKRTVYDGFENFVRMLPPDDSPLFRATPPTRLAQRIRRLFTQRRPSMSTPAIGPATDPASPVGDVPPGSGTAPAA